MWEPFGQGRHGCRQQRAGRCGKTGQGQCSAHLFHVCVEFGPGPFPLGEEDVGVGQQCSGGRGESDLTAVAAEQGHVQLAGELLDLLGDGRRGVVECLGRRGDGAVVADHAQHLEPMVNHVVPPNEIVQ